MSEEQLLDAATDCAAVIRDAETELIRVAYQWAVLHSPDRLDPAEAGRPGRERARMFGGAGTPEVAEFAAAELGARIGRSPYAARQLMADALDLRHRHPQLWARVLAGEVRASYARHVCAKTRDLTESEAAFVDAAVAESADGRIPWSRFEALVEAKVAQADPDTARAKEERAAQARFARRLHGEAHGMASFLVRADAATIAALEATTTAGAARLKPVFPEATDDERCVLTVLHLMTGHDLPTSSGEVDLADLLPTVTLFVHLYAGSPGQPDGEGIARVEGHGPVTEDWVRTVLGPQARFKIQPVLDLAGQAPVDAYEIPDRHRQAVHLMTPADTFPYATCTSRQMQVDHTVPFDAGGATGVGNYGPMTTSHHRIKTHAPGWQVQQPFPGIYLWRDPHGAHYVVDHTGTRRLPRPNPASRLEVEFTNFLINLDLAA
ncbi:MULTISPECIES: HNH endonuclease signature motif containing protein [unclassified Nocardioides]|uniref:HNH endonuclease signature motif containing protein n=1 Tax=unclassified Nocardioides TaxID=2615069 RepID=UPI00361A89AB